MRTNPFLHGYFVWLEGLSQNLSAERFGVGQNFLYIEKREAGGLKTAGFAILWAMQSNPHSTFTFSNPRNMNLRNPQYF